MFYQRNASNWIHAALTTLLLSESIHRAQAKVVRYVAAGNNYPLTPPVRAKDKGEGKEKG